MADDPVSALGGMLEGVAERIGQYAEIWQEAAARNAANEYSSDDALVDLQRTWKLAIGDMAQSSAALIEVLGAMAPKPDVDR
ncbi:MAG: hypothetical protein QOF21_1533 [Actinomycetota bacterium]|jgi:hypothetical protein